MDTLRAKTEGKSSYQARKIAKVSVRRVDEIWKEYLMTGEIPVIGKRVGRLMIPIEKWETELVKRFYEKYRVSADTLERAIERDENIHFSHYKIHKILLELGYAEKKEKTDKRKKDWIRYQRMHSLTAVHIDWHYDVKVWNVLHPRMHLVYLPSGASFLNKIERVFSFLSRDILQNSNFKSVKEAMERISNYFDKEGSIMV